MRHAKGRDVFRCLGVYPETELPGSRKKDARVIDCVMTFIATRDVSGKVTLLFVGRRLPCPLLEKVRQLQPSKANSSWEVMQTLSRPSKACRHGSSA